MKIGRIILSIILAFLAFNVSGLVAAAEEGEEKPGESSSNEDVKKEEGTVTLSLEALARSGIQVKEAGPATLRVTLKVNGRIAPVSSRVAHIAPRFPGIIREVEKDIGDRVEAGELLAVVESNQSLQAYEVRARRPGLITERHATVGESVQGDEHLFVVMDLSQVWADFTVFQRDAGKLRVGHEVSIEVSGLSDHITAKIDFISPVVDEATQSRVARAVLANPESRLAPGAFLTGEITTDEFSVPVAVSEDAIQTMEGKSVVFVVEGDAFEKREVVTGRSDGSLTEVTSGISAGERYAAGNSFILKAELGKGEAEDDD